MLIPTLAGPSASSFRPSSFALMRELNTLSDRLETCVSKGEDHDREISSLRKEIRRMGEQLQEHANLVSERIQALENWKAQFILDMATARPPAPMPGTLASTVQSNGGLESVSAPDIGFDPCTNFNSIVPISDMTVIAALIATYKPRKANDMPKIHLDTQLKVSIAAKSINHPYLFSPLIGVQIALYRASRRFKSTRRGWWSTRRRARERSVR